MWTVHIKSKLKTKFSKEIGTDMVSLDWYHVWDYQQPQSALGTPHFNTR